MASTASDSCSTASFSPSTSMSSTAPASDGYSTSTAWTTASMVTLSIISSAAGMTPLAMMAETARLASSISS